MRRKAIFKLGESRRCHSEIAFARNLSRIISLRSRPDNIWGVESCKHLTGLVHVQRKVEPADHVKRRIVVHPLRLTWLGVQSKWEENSLGRHDNSGCRGSGIFFIGLWTEEWHTEAPNAARMVNLQRLTRGYSVVFILEYLQAFMWFTSARISCRVFYVYAILSFLQIEAFRKSRWGSASVRDLAVRW